ncbi:hypothetical protein Droror1_Dr00005294 [Drosera rotundifolia]
MATVPVYEVEDQTDEDFFDKLVDDDDDGVGGGEMSVGGIEVKELDGGVFGDGDESNEAKAFGKLSLNEPVDQWDDLDVKKETSVDGFGQRLDVLDVGGGNGSLGNLDHSLPSSSSFAFDSDLVVSNEANKHESDSLEAKGEMDGDGEGWNWDGKLDDVLGSEPNASAVAVDSFSFNDGILPNQGIEQSAAKPDLVRSKSVDSASVKVVQWNAFSESAAHGIDGFGSHSDFFSGLGEEEAENAISESKVTPESGVNNADTSENAFDFLEYQEKQGSVEQVADVQDLNNSQYFENQYPGWKYDPYSGQWYQVDGYDGTANGQQNIEATAGNGTASVDGSAASYWGITDVQSSQTYAQQTAQSIPGTLSHMETASNQVSQANNEYPAHMIFDPQYPGWYYDTIAQEWLTLEAYYSTVQSAVQTIDQPTQNGFASVATESLGYHNSTYNHGSSSANGQSWATPASNYSQLSSNMWQPESSHVKSSVADSGPNLAWENTYIPNSYSDNHTGQQNSNNVPTQTFHGKSNEAYDSSAAFSHSNNSIPDGSYAQRFNQPGKLDSNGPLEYPNEYYNNQRAESFAQQFSPNSNQFVPNVGRSSAGRPPHALVTFGFGGKLIVMEDGSSLLGGKESEGHSLSVLNLLEVVKENGIASGPGRSSCSYLHSLCHRAFPGPLTGGSGGNKEVNKWIDESISNCESPDVDHRKGRVMKLLLSLLKIACQHYGKLRSLGTESAMRENDLPELAVANLFASSKKDGVDFGQYYASTKFLMNLPTEAQMQRTASDIQNLLVAGKRREALQSAEEGQLWPFALILARELGEQFYLDTVKRMAFSQLMAGTPLRTLCLLIAKKPEDVFSNNSTAGNVVSPRSARMSPQSLQFMGYNMLDNWEENLAVITANRTENDHLVITHLGDSLWKERSDSAAAHICYLIAEADFGSYSESARLCLIGGDHLNFPRTYASPEAIQRTELFEYSKVIGNSQFVLLPFQPYKLVYAYMLAEVGKVSDALKYCQAIYRSLKTGRTPEIDALKQQVSSLEDRLRTHQQGGYAVNLAPAKIMGKLLNLFDSTTHRVVGGLPPPVPSNSQNNLHSYDQHQAVAPKVSNSQSTMAMSSLMSSSSMDLDNNKMTVHNRSLSEPDIGRTPRQDHVDSSNDASSTNPEGKASALTGSSRFARFNFGSQILQKTVGLVLRSRHQAKLGEANKFYYDEKLKTWVEEGAANPAAAAIPPPPPTTSSFQSSPTDNFSKSASNDGGPAIGSPEFGSSTSSESSAAFPSMPSIPPTSNQFSARGRMGVRARYVDTFNKGGGSPSNLFQTPSAPSMKPTNASAAKFFIPSAASLNEQSPEATTGITQEATGRAEVPSIPMIEQSQKLQPSSLATIPRFSSFDSIPNVETKINGQDTVSSLSRRTSSWNGIHGDTFSPSEMGKFRHPGESLGMSPLPSIPGNSSSDHLHMNRGLGDDLQEVEL